MTPYAAWIAAALLLGGCARAAHPKPTPPPLLIDQRGTTMPFREAVKHIAFRPLIPSPQVLAYAVLPPLGGPDTDAHRGLGIEFVAHGQALLLSQWPKGTFAVGFGHGGGPTASCRLARYSPTGWAWITPQAIVTTLQPDGNVDARFVAAEARALMDGDSCRGRAR